MAIFKKLFGGGAKKAKSVNQIRGRTQAAKSPDSKLDARIAARRDRTLKKAEIKAILSAAPDLPKPDITKAVRAAEQMVREPASKEKKAIIDHALRLKGSDRLIRETLAHPLRQYIGLAIVRGLLEGEGKESRAERFE